MSSTTTTPATNGGPTTDADRAADRAERLLSLIVKHKGGSRRDGQVKMARHVAASLTAKRPLMVQGGTGIGKSLAYLIGALGADRQTAVAPHTKALQDQLRDDLDLIADAFTAAAEDEEYLNALDDYERETDLALFGSFSYAVIKGRASYLCLAKTSGAPGDGDEPTALLDLEEAATGGPASEPTSELGKEIKKLTEWSKNTTNGDRVDLPFPVSGRAWDQVSTSANDCTGKACPFYEECFAERAHEEAKAANIIVINQKYLALGMKLPFLLPQTLAAVIVDEAHEFSAVVADTFGATVTTKRMLNVITKARSAMELKKDTRDGKKAEDAERVTNDFGKMLEDATRRLSIGADRTVLPKEPMREALSLCRDTFRVLEGMVETHMSGTSEKEKAHKQNTERMLQNLVEDLGLLLDGDTDEQVAWVEKEGGGGGVVMRAARFDVSDTIFEGLLYEKRAVVFTSATLTVEGGFEIPAKTMGFSLGPWTGQIVESPFDYQRQGVVYTPENMPEPSTKPDKAEDYYAAVAAEATEVARAAGGRTLVLCTSRKSVNAISERLQASLGSEFPVLTQAPGVLPKDLARQFSEDPRSILVGTRTFWTGVSVEGDTCAAVVIDKIPFPSPGDPIIAARSEKADREDGRGAGFRQVSLAEASLTLVQGVGRLIRTVHDRGVIVICDPRVHTSGPFVKRYGAGLRRSLPPFPGTTNKAKVLEFLRDIDATADDAAPAKVEVEETATEGAEQ